MHSKDSDCIFGYFTALFGIGLLLTLQLYTEPITPRPTQWLSFPDSTYWSADLDYQCYDTMGLFHSSSTNVGPKINAGHHITLGRETLCFLLLLAAGDIATNPGPIPSGSLAKLKFINVNCQSVRAKGELLLNLFDSEAPDILIGTESWLNSDINSSEYLPESYTIYRKDRLRNPYGGTFIAVKSSISSMEVNPTNSDNELVWIKVDNINSSPVYVGAFYRPPESSDSYIQVLNHSLNNLPTNCRIILCGDFNLPDINWCNNSFISCGRYPAPSKMLLNVMHDFNLFQMVRSPTRGKSILDLCLTNIQENIQNVQVKDGISDHDIVVFDATIHPTRTRPVRRKIYQFSKGNYDSISQHLQHFYEQEFSNLPESTTVNDAWLLFKQELSRAMDSFIPSKMSSSRFSYPWIDASLRRQVRKKQRLYNKAKHSSDPDHQSAFRKFRRELDRSIRIAYRSYLQNIICSSLDSNNTKPFWKFIKSKRNFQSSINTLIKGNSAVTSAIEKAELLNEYFCSVFTKENTDSMPSLCTPAVCHSIPNLDISEQGVKKLLDELQVNKSSGPDGISPYVLKMCSTAIAPLFTTIYRKSINTGQLPQDWHTAVVTPIYKKGSPTDPGNYRPVSLTSIPCKLLEHIIHHHVMDYLDRYQLMTNVQHGFRKNHSCETQLAITTNDLARSLDCKAQTDVVITDFSKAFDKVPHKRLAYKLQHYGISGKILSWINAFLSQRTQCVVINGVKSSLGAVSSGVPQGTVLGPLLFSLYINDLPTRINSTIRMFADDCILYRTIDCINDSHRLQQDLDEFSSWSKSWQIDLNASKCKSMVVTNKRRVVQSHYVIDGTPLELVKEHSYLGVTITSNLSWTSHINNIACKASKVLGLIRRHLHDCDIKTKVTAYKSLVRPCLEYASSVWDPYKACNIDKLEMVQRKAARFICKDYRRTTSVTALLQQLGFTTLKERRRDSRLKLFHKSVNKLVALPVPDFVELNNHRSRSSLSANGPSYRHVSVHTDAFKWSFWPRTIPDWNSCTFKPSIQHRPTVLSDVGRDGSSSGL